MASFAILQIILHDLFDIAIDSAKAPMTLERNGKLLEPFTPTNYVHPVVCS